MYFCFVCLLDLLGELKQVKVSEMKREDLVLILLMCKQNHQGSLYGKEAKELIKKNFFFFCFCFKKVFIIFF